jgi:hypothetical protein
MAIGAGQTLSLPGVSRSAATILAGLLAGLIAGPRPSSPSAGLADSTRHRHALWSARDHIDHQLVVAMAVGLVAVF